MIYVVTEGATDAAVLAAILRSAAKSADNLRVVPAGGRSSAESYARSLLLTAKGPVALVVDGETTEDSRIAELQHSLTRSLSEVAANARYKVFVMKPEIEGILFNDSDIASNVLGSIDNEDVIRGQFAPKATLDKLLHGRRLSDIISKPNVAAKLADLHTTQIDELRAFVRDSLPA